MTNLCGEITSRNRWTLTGISGYIVALPAGVVTMIDRYIAFLSPKEKRALYWIFALILFGACFESIGLALVLPYIGFLQKISQENTIPFSSVALVTTAFLTVILGRMGMQLWVNRTVTKFAYQMGENHSQRLFQRYLEMDYQQFVTKNSKTLVKNCTHSIDEASLGLLLLLQGLSALLVASGLMIVLLIDNTSATLILITGFTLLIVPTYKYFKHKQRLAGQERDSILGDISKLTSEAFYCFKDIHLYNKADYFNKQFSNRTKRLTKANADSTFYPLLPSPCIEAIAMCALLGVILWFMWANIPMQQLVPQLIFYGVIGRRLLPSVHQTIYFAMALQKLQPCMELVHQEYLQTPTRASPPNIRLPFDDEVRFNKVSYNYASDRSALQEISISLKRHQSVALVGPSGSGKSTIAEILTSLLTPNQGHLFLDDQPVTNLSSLRDRIGYVPQMVSLLDDTIEKNIAFGEEVTDPIRLHNALEMAHLNEWLPQLPDGLQTIIGERGIKLSGGQRQRIGIARALYFNPEIMIFDEATASLDLISERIITENILEIAGHKTILAIAHRISTVHQFDKIYVVNEGRIVNEGTHQELMEICELYRAMNG